MNKDFSTCDKCESFEPLKYKTAKDAFNQWEGVCINKKFRKRFRVNSSSESCPRGALKGGLIPNNIIPDKPINRGDFFE